jgi:hypothetical protein
MVIIFGKNRTYILPEEALDHAENQNRPTLLELAKNGLRALWHKIAKLG